jgi:hypothetical protein
MPKKISKYNLILKEFTKVNNKLSQEQQLSIRQRRDIIKNVLMPLYKNVPNYKIRLKPLRQAINKEVDLIPPKEICDLNYIDVSEYALVEWFSLDETIRELIPDCVYVKVSAGEFGETKIFNTRNYEYGSNKVRDIVEAIRPYAENESGRYIFSGYQKLRPRKRNNGVSENYYLDLILIQVDSKGNEIPAASTDTVRFELPKDRETKKKKTKVKHIIEGRIKRLKQKRDSKRRAKKTLENNIKKYTDSVKKATRKKASKVTKQTVIKQFQSTASLLEKYKKQGKITDYNYEKSLEKILKELDKYTSGL